MYHVDGSHGQPRRCGNRVYSVIFYVVYIYRYIYSAGVII